MTLDQIMLVVVLGFLIASTIALIVVFIIKAWKMGQPATQEKPRGFPFIFG